MHKFKKFALQWQGIQIEIHYVPCWHYIGDGDFISHAEIHSEDRVPLPITHTGYRSHFFPSRKELSSDELIQLVTEWLAAEAAKPEWIEADEKRKQLCLF